MTQTGGTNRRSVIPLLLGVLVAVALGSVLLSGTAVTQSSGTQTSGEVDVEDTIYADQASFDVSVGPLDNSTGCVAIYKNGEYKQEASFRTAGDEVVSISKTSVDGYESRDDITAELQIDSMTAACAFFADNDTTTVTATGSVDLDDRIYADQTSFEVTVTELRTDGNVGCLDIYKNGEFQHRRNDVAEGDVVNVTESDVDGFREGDEITARLYNDFCEEDLDADSTTVTATGTLDLEDPIYADENFFLVEVTELRTSDGQGCVVARNSGGTEASRTEVTEGETLTFTESEVAPFSAGDTITAELRWQSHCDSDSVATESTTVTATGSVDVEDTIYADQTSFEVTVTELRIDDDAGCVFVDNSGGGDTQATDFNRGETRNITESDVGSFQDGDQITATLVAQSACNGRDLDTDSTMVTLAPTTATPTATPTETATATATETATETETPTPDIGSGGPGNDTVPTFEVTIDDVRVTERETRTLEVDTTIENTGTGSDTQTVTLTVGGAVRDSRELTLTGGESQSVLFSWENPTDIEQQNITVASEDDLDESTVQLTDSATDEGGGGLISGDSGGMLLLLLLLALLLAYYYVRRRQMAE